jgi:beta-mannosidase
MNMIRHWGGGYYETDEFYSICDELGIMVWQDFMFGNDWQPGTYAFKLNIEAEAEDQVRRLRNHPSIVSGAATTRPKAPGLGARAHAAADVKYQMWQDYLTEFSGILPRVVARLDRKRLTGPARPAPTTSRSPDLSQRRRHIWDVWHGACHSRLTKRIMRALSRIWIPVVPGDEDGRSIHEPEDRTGIFTPVMLAHQKNNEGNSIIHDYLLKDYPSRRTSPAFSM